MFERTERKEVFFRQPTCFSGKHALGFIRGSLQSWGLGYSNDWEGVRLGGGCSEDFTGNVGRGKESCSWCSVAEIGTKLGTGSGVAHILGLLYLFGLFCVFIGI